MCRFCISIALVFLIVGCAAPRPRDYYFASFGNDSSGDGTIHSPFRTIAKANTLRLNPGDRVLFESGASFDGNLILERHDAGTPDRPVTIASFGEGAATLHATTGTAIHIADAGGIFIQNLVLVGDGAPGKRGCGIEIVNQRRGREKFIRIEKVVARGFGEEGIRIAGKSGGFEDVEIRDCQVSENVHCGIFVSGIRKDPVFWSHKSLRVINCAAFDNMGDPFAKGENRSGSGIFITGVDDGLVEHCAAYRNGRRCRAQTGGPLGIWASESNRVVIQKCQAYENATAGRHDGGGFGFDGGVTNSLMQFNFAHHNQGSGFGLFQYPGALAWHDNTLRHNISLNDGRKNGYAGIHLWNGGSGLARATVSDNVVITSPAPNAPKCVWIQTDSRGLRMTGNFIIALGNVWLIGAGDNQPAAHIRGNTWVLFALSN
jgi:hypothetical protein